MTDAIKPTATAETRRTPSRSVSAQFRCWLRDLSTRFAWLLVARHKVRRSYCISYRSNFAILLHGLDRDVALTLLCEPVHCYSHAVNLAWESGAESHRSPALKR